MRRTQYPIKIKGERFVYCERCGVLVHRRFAQKVLTGAFPDILGSGRIIGDDDIHYFCENHKRDWSTSTVPNYEWTTDLTGNGYWKELPRESKNE